MNIIKQPEWSNLSTDVNTRRWILWWVVAILLTWTLILNDEKKNQIKQYDLNGGYNNMRMNFDQFFIHADQDISAPWSRDTWGGKDLIIDTEKKSEYYLISLLGNQINLSLLSYKEEFLCRYNVDTSILEVKGNATLWDILNHFWLVQKLIKKQYPNF